MGADDVQAEQIKNLKESDDKQWTEIDGIKQRLQKLVPVWVTITLMVMSGVTGSALTVATMIMKFSGN